MRFLGYAMIITIAYMTIVVVSEIGAKNLFKIAAYSVATIVALKVASFLFGLAPDVYSTLSEWAAIAISLAFVGFSLYACAVVLGDLFHVGRDAVMRY